MVYHPRARWTSPPSRREVTLLAFSLTIFVLSYNLETSLRMVGVKPEKLGGGYLVKVGLASQDPGYTSDGRRPQGYRDTLETLIAGDWVWDSNSIAGGDNPTPNPNPNPNSNAVGSHSWLTSSGSGNPMRVIFNPGNEGGKGVSRSAEREDAGVGLAEGGVGMWEGFGRWGEEGKEAEESRVLVHVPGYTVVDNLYVLNGTFYLVSSSPSTSLPSLAAIGSSLVNSGEPPREQDWRVIDPQEAKEVLGGFGGRIHGTTYLSTDDSSSQDPYTIFSLLRLHTSLAVPSLAQTASVSSSGLRVIAPDGQGLGLAGLGGVEALRRVVYAQVPAFSSPQLGPPNGDVKEHPPMRVKSFSGSHPLLLKSLLPTTAPVFTEVLADIADMHVPHLFTRVVLADRGAAERGRSEWDSHWVPSSSSSSSNKPGSGELRKRQSDKTSQVNVDGAPVWAAPFVGLDELRSWFAPARASLLSYLGLPPSAPFPAPPSKKAKGWNNRVKTMRRTGKPVLTYISNQDEPRGAGSRVKREDHERLVKGLEGLVAEGVLGGMNIVKGNGTADGEVWEDRMVGIVTSEIMLGSFGHHLSDALFMPFPSSLPSSLRTKPAHKHKQNDVSDDEDEEKEKELEPPVLMEFFPDGVFLRDQEWAVKSLGGKYVAWWNERKFTHPNLPPVMAPRNTLGGPLIDPEVTVDVNAVLAEVRKEATRLMTV